MRVDQYRPFPLKEDEEERESGCVSRQRDDGKKKKMAGVEWAEEWYRKEVSTGNKRGRERERGAECGWI